MVLFGFLIVLGFDFLLFVLLCFGGFCCGFGVFVFWLVGFLRFG